MQIISYENKRFHVKCASQLRCKICEKKVRLLYTGKYSNAFILVACDTTVIRKDFSPQQSFLFIIKFKTTKSIDVQHYTRKTPKFECLNL